ncbi:MAG: DUF3226 domain-containing protein [Saprospiraceae bacterium]
MKQHLLTEGNDFHLILQVCGQHGLKRPAGFLNQKEFEQKFVIKNRSGQPLGKTEVLGYVDEVAKTADLQAFAIVVDADSDVAATWQSVCDKLKNVGYSELPTSPDLSGTVHADTNPDLPKVGIWLMPDNQNPGEIEDFFLQLIPAGDGTLEAVSPAVQDLIDRKQNLFPDSDRSKAEAHTWLAWQKEPGRSMGVALKNGWADAKSPLASKLADWFALVFELEK